MNAPPLAIPMEKKDCPSAAINVSLVMTLKSTFKYHFNPSIAPGRVRDLMASIISMINRVGIIILQAFSIPFSRPREDIRPIMIRHATV